MFCKRIIRKSGGFVFVLCMIALLSTSCGNEGVSLPKETVMMEKSVSIERSGFASGVNKTDAGQIQDTEEAAAEQARLEEEARQAAEQARLEEEARQAAEQARLEEEARQSAEQARLEEEARQAAEQARLEEEARQAAEQARLEEEARQAAEQARKEEEARQAAEQARLEEEARQAAEQARLEEEARKAAEQAKETQSGKTYGFDTYDNPGQQETDAVYVLNTNTMKVHHPDCTSVKKIKPENYAVSSQSIAELEAQGYSRCKQKCESNVWK